ncbi:hypothetical protein PGTUg99_027801 [Puccinia graminis f. sp. tritici]|uniref:CxC5 like cysteine cluster associated with KDZ domain-containing protein n=1 Tax=Puccinia graminis f. sp. tritici TaxID=56615 RepID=A0A5B0S7J4_PUCGR|nr:hypothetical protein PGTUg99_027801 [Puccinia graminis f. sp. tritici]
MVKFLCVAANVVINSNGIMAELGDGRIPTRIVHQSLFPPVEHCQKCSKKRPMRRSSLFGYLYDVDGGHTIEHFSLYCQPCQTSYHMSQMLQRCSVFSIANLYNSTFMGDHTPPMFTAQQSFFPCLSVEVCKDGMDIDTLIFNHASRDKVLMVPSSGPIGTSFPVLPLNLFRGSG